MRTKILTLALSWLVSASWSAVEAGGETGFRRIAQTSRANYYSQAGDSLDVDVQRSEAFLDRLFVLFGAPESPWRMEYYRHASVEALRGRLGFAAYGATDTATLRVDSVRSFHPHELVHAVTARLGHPPLLFSEGIAVALTAEGRWRGREMDAVALGFNRSGHGLARLVQRFGEEDPDAAYAVSGSFIGFLLDRYGIEPLIAFLRGCPTPDAYERALGEAYGRGLADLEFDWQRTLQHPGTGHDWYDAQSWPSSLQRGAAARIAAGPARPTSLREQLLESARRSGDVTSPRGPDAERTKGEAER